MRVRFAINLSICCGISMALLGCAEMAAPNPADAKLAQRTISSNARALGARVQTVGDTASIVQYRGSARNYAQCITPRGNALANVALDSRTTIRLSGSRARATTLYLATARLRDARGRRTPQSVAFTQAKPGKFANGITCRATGVLERRILGK